MLKIFFTGFILKFYNFLSRLIILFIIPHLILPCMSFSNTSSLAYFENQSKETNRDFKSLYRLINNSYFSLIVDQKISLEPLINFLELMESENIEEIFTKRQLKEINEIILQLIQFGSFLDKDGLLLKEMEEIINQEENYSFSLDYLYENDCQFYLADSCNKNEIILCTNIFKKCGKKIVKFVKKHKREIIIAGSVAAFVITGAVIVYNNHEDKKAEQNPNPNSNSYSNPDLSSPNNMLPFGYSGNEETSQLDNFSGMSENNQDIFFEFLEKDLISYQEDYQEWFDEGDLINDVFFEEKVKDFTSLISHEIVDAVIDYGLVVPRMLDEIKEISLDLFPDFLEESGNVLEGSHNLDDLKNIAHKVVDKVFFTDFAEAYTLEAQKNAANIIPDYSIGIVPPPGALGFVAQKDCTGKLLPTQVNDIKGWSLGEPINNRTRLGNEPSWSTVRQRYWKNKAYYEPEFFKDSVLFDNVDKEMNIARAKKGLAPKVFNSETGALESMELHHIPPQREGGLFDVEPVSPQKHAEIDDYRKLKD